MNSLILIQLGVNLASQRKRAPPPQIEIWEAKMYDPTIGFFTPRIGCEVEKRFGALVAWQGADGWCLTRDSNTETPSLEPLSPESTFSHNC